MAGGMTRRNGPTLAERVDWAATTAGAAEALDLATGSGQPALTLLPRGWLALLAAVRGNDAEVARHLDALQANPAAGITASLVDDIARWARALTAYTPTAALHQLEQMTNGIVTRLAAVDRIETAVRAERLDLAANWTDE